jgi:hypothetical protein
MLIKVELIEQDNKNVTISLCDYTPSQAIDYLSVILPDCEGTTKQAVLLVLVCFLN